MRKVKWIFFAYMALVALILCGIGLSFGLVPARQSDTLYLTLVSQVPTMDPPRISDVPGSEIAGHMFETLYNYDYYKRPIEIIPELADGMPLISADGKTVTIKVKPGIHYFDPHGGIANWEEVKDEKGAVVGRKGPEVTAADFVYSWKRLCNFHLDSQWYAAMFEGKVVGIEDFRAHTQKSAPDQVDYLREVQGFQAPDRFTIVIKLRDPFPQLVYNLAHLPSAPMSREAVDTYKDDIKFRPVATGPYYLVTNEFRPDERFVFKANPLYRGAPDAPAINNIPPAERLPYAKRIRIDYFEEPLPAWALFQQELVDVAPIPKDSFSIAIDPMSKDLREGQKDKGIKLIKGFEPTVFFFGFNMSDPVVGKNKPLRQAMSMALDRQEYIDLMLNGRGLPAKTLIPPEFPTYDPNAVNPYAELNIPAAKEKMKEAERVHGGPIPEISLVMGDTSTSSRQAAELLQTHMSKIGVKLKVEYVTWPRFLQMVDSKQAQFFSLGWQADYPDEQTFFQLFYSKNGSPGPNHSNYNNPAYDALYEKSIVMSQSPERDALYVQMARMIQEDVPVILDLVRISYRLHYDWVSNLIPCEYRHGNRAYWKLDVAMRRESLARK